jgi:hypothetical protein
MRIKFLIYILFSYYSIYGQLEINDTITDNKIYWQEQFRSLYESDINLSTIIAIDINQNRENTMANKHLEVYKWLNVYDTKKFKIKVFVINESSSKNNFKVCCDENNEKIECSQSTLFFITRNKSQKDFLSKNLNVLFLKSIPIKNKEGFEVYQLTPIKDPGDFKWKTEQLLYNLQNIPQIPKTPTPKTNFFQISYQSSLIRSKNTQFDAATNNQIDLIMKKKKYLSDKNKESIDKDSIQILFGGGISLAQNRFSSSNNSQQVEKGSYPLDSIYASLSGVRENHLYQSINFVGFFAVKFKRFEISLSPFFALQSNLSSNVIGGSITTYGFNDQINEYLYDIPELGLKTQTEEILKVQNYFKTRSYGINAGVSYNINLGTLIVAPNLNLKFISIHNKNPISNAYSIPEDKYNGVFASLKKINYFFIPTLGLSISF